jgi:hypothetical protein
VSWGGLRLGHARDGAAEQQSDGSEQTYHKDSRFVSQDASTGSESGLGSPHNTLHKQGTCRHALTSIGQEGSGRLRRGGGPFLVAFIFLISYETILESPALFQ